MQGLSRRMELRNYSLVVVLAVIWLALQFLTDGLFLSQR